MGFCQGVGVIGPIFDIDVSHVDQEGHAELGLIEASVVSFSCNSEIEGCSSVSFHVKHKAKVSSSNTLWLESDADLFPEWDYTFYIAEAFPHFACIRMGKQMGYITEYTLDIEAPNDALYREVEIWLERWSDDDWQNFVDHAKQFHIGIDQRTPPFSTDIIKNIWKADSWSAKWYSWKDDMTRLSFMFPKVLFTLSGHGVGS